MGKTQAGHQLELTFETKSERALFEEWLQREHKEMVHAGECGALTPLGKAYKRVLDSAVETAQHITEDGGEE